MPRSILAPAAALTMTMMLLPPRWAAAQAPADQAARTEAARAEAALLHDKAARLRDERAPMERSHQEAPFLLADLQLQLARQALDAGHEPLALPLLQQAAALLAAVEAQDPGETATTPDSPAATPAAGPAATVPAFTLCVHPDGGTPGGEFCLTTIQAAVDVARPGTLIRVLPAVYREAVVVPIRKDGVQIVGQDVETTILEGSITVAASDVQIRTLTMRATGTAVALQASRALVQGLRSADTSRPGISASGGVNAGHRILGNEVLGGVAVFGPDMAVQDNVVTGGIFVGGPRSVVTGNRVTGGGITSTAIVAIDSEASLVVVRANDVRGAETGIFASSRNTVVEDNQVSAFRTGLFVSCSSLNPEDPGVCREGSIARNTVAVPLGIGFSITALAPGLPVRNNHVLQSQGGMSLGGRGVVVEDNRVSDCNFAPFGQAFVVFGPDHVLRRNVAFRCHNVGFSVTGSAVRLEGNGAVGNFGNGFVVQGSGGTTAGVVLERNLASANTGVGIAIVDQARDTVVRGNRATGNGLDFCDGGIGTVLAGNMFGTVGPCPF
jgi:parallel beta-helix repeat protein